MTKLAHTEPKTLTLYSYQWEFCRKILRSFAGGQQQIALVSPMGSGKSNIATYLTQRALRAEIVKHVALFTPQETTRDAYLPGRERAKRMLPPDEVAGDAPYLYHLPCENPPTTDGWRLLKSDLLTTRQGVARSAVVGTYAALFVYHTVQEGNRMVIPEDMSKVLPEDMSDTMIIMDEGHHSQGDGENEEDLNLTARMRDLFIQRGARIFYMTATPYRADGADMADWRHVRKFYRSIARHAEEGYAPKNWRFQTHVMEGCAYNPSPEELKLGAQSIATYWNQMGRPKTVIRVPADNGISVPWSEALMEAFQPLCGDRVFNAVGSKSNWSARDQERFNDAIRTEGQHYDQIAFDVFISCRRFNEGTDWPPAAACFQVGSVPRAIPNTLQFFGRSLRRKDRIEGYPEDFKDTSHLVYFLYDKSKGSERAPESEREHQTRTLLLTAFLENCEFSFGGLRNEFRSNLPRGRLREQSLEILDAVDDQERARILLSMAEFVARYKVLNDGREPSLGEMLRFIVSSNEYSNEQKIAALDIIYSRLPKDIKERILPYIRGVLSALAAQQQGGDDDDDRYVPDDRIPRERESNPLAGGIWDALSPLLQELIREYADRFNWTSEKFLNSCADMMGTDAKAIHQYLTRGMDASDLTDEMIVALLVKTKEETGKFPSPDGSEVVALGDKRLTWASIARAVGQRLHGASLARLYDARDFILSETPLSRVLILQAIQKRASSARRKTPKVTYRHIQAWLNPTQKLTVMERSQVDRVFEHLTLPDLKPQKGVERYTWTDIELALQRGWRGLPGGQSLTSLQEKAPWPFNEPPSQTEIENALQRLRHETGAEPKEVLWEDAGRYVDLPEGLIVWNDLLKLRQKR